MTDHRREAAASPPNSQFVEHSCWVHSELDEPATLIYVEPSSDRIAPAVSDDLIQKLTFDVFDVDRPLRSLRGLAVKTAHCRVVDGSHKSVTAAGRDPIERLFKKNVASPVISDLASDLIAAMDQMSERTRAVFHACGIEGRSGKETSNLLGISLHAVSVCYLDAIQIVGTKLGMTDAEADRSKRAC